MHPLHLTNTPEPLDVRGSESGFVE